MAGFTYILPIKKDGTVMWASEVAEKVMANPSETVQSMFEKYCKARFVVKVKSAYITSK